jgi:adenylylsulfate kinase
MKEAHYRSVVKGITWRIIASVTTMALVFIFTGDLLLMAEIGAIEITANIMFYYFHERIWGAVKWGKLGREPLS